MENPIKKFRKEKNYSRVAFVEYIRRQLPQKKFIPHQTLAKVEKDPDILKTTILTVIRSMGIAFNIDEGSLLNDYKKWCEEKLNK